MTNLIFEFGPFQLYPGLRKLERASSTVPLGGREFDLLLALIERKGEILDHGQLAKIVWQGINVSEPSVRVHMSGLRKALGEVRGSSEFVRTIPGRGYTFAAHVHRRENIAEVIRKSKRGLPALMIRVIGRRDLIASVQDQLLKGRLVSLIGPAGVGKTTVALACATNLLTEFSSGIYFVDLSAINRSDQVATEIAIALGLSVDFEDPIGGILNQLRESNTLIILDNCEHVIEGAAGSALRLAEGAEKIAMLITSREPLGLALESICRLLPLEIPPDTGPISLENARSYSAVELFEERAAASSGDFRLEQSNVERIANLCRRLDGIPLAIEFAASRMDEFGLDGVVSRLGDRFALLNEGRRTAVPRHYTLRDTIDWSFSLLTSFESAALEAFAIFRGPFTLLSATRVAGGNKPDTSEFEALLSNLVSKSMLTENRDSSFERFRLLDMTRDFARERLVLSGRERAVSLAHANDCTEVLKQAELDWHDGISPVWMAAFGHRLNDVRSAIAWCFAANNDPDLGVRLTALASVLFIPFGLVQEYLTLLNVAISTNALSAKRDRGLDGRLYCSLGTALYHTQSHNPDNGARDAFVMAAQASTEANDLSGALRALSALSASHLLHGDYASALGLKADFAKLGALDSHTGHRTFAHSNHYAGNLDKTKFHIEAAMAFAKTSFGHENSSAQYDAKQMNLRSTLAQHLWLTGFPDQAMAIVDDFIEEARPGNHAPSFCQVLSTAGFPLALALGGVSRAEPVLKLLSSLAEKHSAMLWLGWAKAYGLIIRPRNQRGTRDASSLFDLFYPPTKGVQLEYLSILGDEFTEPWIIEQAMMGTPCWCMPELIRARGHILLGTKGGNVAAEALFTEAWKSANEQGSIAWRLRASISRAQLLCGRDARIEAKAILNAELDGWTEGFESVDIVRATSLLKEIE
jgi:predicted ATPase/DNA-binding winged helix-turn-helix (wHTH) protein